MCSIKTIKKQSLSADLIDLRTLSPLDNESIIQSVRKTGKAIILQEDSLFGGLASEIPSIIMENCFEKKPGVSICFLINLFSTVINNGFFFSPYFGHINFDGMNLLF